MRKRYLICALVALALSGCGQAESPTGGSGASAPQLDATAAPTAAPLPTPAADQTPTQEPTAPASPTDTASTPPDKQLVQAARDDLAAHLGVPPEQLTLQSASAQEWPNSALGCPDADNAYLEVITPGFKMVFTNGTSDYAVHTAQTKEAMVLCANDQPVSLSGTADAGGTPAQPIDGGDNATLNPSEQAGALPGSQPVGLNERNRAQVALARQQLTSKAAVQDGEISVVSVEEVEWRDSSLGCPEPEMMYMQVITPGYRITLEAQGRRYTYHSDLGQQVILCEKGPRG